jgi:hypothetical protein
MRSSEALFSFLALLAETACAAAVGGKSSSVAVPAPHQSSPLLTRQLLSGSIAANPSTNDQGITEGYYSPISIGGQSFNVLFDTGSAVDWVWGSNDTSGTRGARPFYTPNPLEGSFLIAGERLAINYSDTTDVRASNVYIDNVKVGPISAITAFGAANSVVNPSQTG